MAGRRTPGLRHAQRTPTTESTRWAPAGTSRSSSTASHWPPPTAWCSSSRPACHPAGTSRLATSDGTGSPTARTTCQYKGLAHYWTVDDTEPPLSVWSYLEPLPETASLSDSSAFPMTTRQCNCSSTTPQPTTRTPAEARPARLAAGSRSPGCADDIEAGRCSGRDVGPLPARGGHGRLSATDDDPAQAGAGFSWPQ